MTMIKLLKKYSTSNVIPSQILKDDYMHHFQSAILRREVYEVESHFIPIQLNFRTFKIVKKIVSCNNEGKTVSQRHKRAARSAQGI